MKVMNVAVVGAGIYGINHVNAYTWNPNTNLVAVCDLNKEITDRIAEQYNVKTYNDVNEMLDNEEIDAVSIATPDAFHMDPALVAIRHGKPILVEKPLATTSEDAKRILAEAEKYNVRVAVDCHVLCESDTKSTLNNCYRLFCAVHSFKCFIRHHEYFCH